MGTIKSDMTGPSVEQLQGALQNCGFSPGTIVSPRFPFVPLGNIETHLPPVHDAGARPGGV